MALHVMTDFSVSGCIWKIVFSSKNVIQFSNSPCLQQIFYCCKIDCYNLVTLTFQFWSGLVGNNRGYLFACENLEMVICTIKMTKIFLHFRYWIKTKLNNNKQLLLLQRLSSKIALSFSFYQMYNALSSLCSVLDI